MSALLLAYLIRAEDTLADRTILIVEPSDGPAQPKNICFWADELPALPLTLKGSWDAMSFGGKRGNKTQKIDPFTYYCFDAATLQNQLRDELDGAAGVTMMQDRVVRIEDDTVFLRQTPGGLRAKQYVFDSLPPVGSTVSLWQHFLGWEVKVTNEAEFDADALTLMDFRVAQAEAPTFMYMLPFSPQKALFEITLMSSDILSTKQYEAYLKTYLSTHYPQLEYTITRTERGKIPMQRVAAEASSPRQVRLGIKGGMAKPTTGYTFLNSYRHARQIVSLLAGGKSLSLLPTAKPRFVFYDRLLLNIIRRSPQRVKPIMEALFYRNSYPRLLAFLSESTSLWQETKLFCTLPWLPFLTALSHEYLLRAPRDEAQSHPDWPVLYPAHLEVDRNLERAVD